MKNGFLVIHDWMMSDLQLRGPQLQVFSILYSLSQNGESDSGSLQGLAARIGGTKQMVSCALKALISKHYLCKEQNQYTISPEILKP